MIMAEKSFKAQVVVVEVPQLYSQIRRTRYKVLALAIVVNAVYRV